MWRHRWRVTLLAPYLDVQYACTKTGCSTMRLAPSSSPTRAVGTCSRFGSVIIDQRHHGTTRAKELCVAFETPRGSYPLTFGYVMFARDAASPEDSMLQGGIDEIAWAYPMGGF
jgi:hypothetical protein